MSSGEASTPSSSTRDTYVVIGGGIAGVCCAQELARLQAPRHRILLISASEVITQAACVASTTSRLHEITVVSKTARVMQIEYPSIEIMIGTVQRIDYETKSVYIVLSDGNYTRHVVSYTKVCICAGARPDLLCKSALPSTRVVGIRDVASLDDLAARLRTARRVVIAGNGGIALELVHQLESFEVDWIIKDEYVGNVFFDASASDFIMPSLLKRSTAKTYEEEDKEGGRTTATAVSSPLSTSTSCTVSATISAPASDNDVPATEDESRPIKNLGLPLNGTKTKEGDEDEDERAASSGSGSGSGAGAGPDWLTKCPALQAVINEAKLAGSRGYLKIHTLDKIISVTDHGSRSLWKDSQLVDLKRQRLKSEQDLPLEIVTEGGKRIHCDFLVSATGVVPNTEWTRCSNDRENSIGIEKGPNENECELTTDAEGFIMVDAEMRCSITDVYSAGDCCNYMPGWDRRNTSAHGMTPAVVTKISTPPLPSPPATTTTTPSMPTHFFQMKLWSQARIMGMYAAQSMCSCIEDYGLEAQFDIFAHMTKFFGYKVVLLGRFNAQGLGNDIECATKKMVVTGDGKFVSSLTKEHPSHHKGGVKEAAAAGASAAAATESAQQQPLSCVSATEIWLRITPNEEYIKLVVHRGKVVGALLIGDTGLEEVFENLILDRLDVSGLGIGILDPEKDIADYFD